MARMTSTAETLARAALAFIDENGVEALTIRALGQSVDMHHTAIYRHYRSKNELLRAVLALVIADAFGHADSLPDDPEQRLLTLITGLREALRSHPAVTVAYLLPVETLADSQAVSQVQQLVISALRDLGLSDHELIVRYQMLESFALGSSVFDFGGAPDHLSSRRRRHQTVSTEDFALLASSEERVEAVTESAFALGLATLVAECAAAGRSSRQPEPAAVGDPG